MKKRISMIAICTTLGAVSSIMINAQAAFDVAQLGQNDLRGTARYMSMAGAYGALGGDLSTLANNPAGIGVYRYSDVGITLGLNFQSSKTSGEGSVNNTLFSCNNAAYVGVFNLNSETTPNFNWGFSYNRVASFNRRTAGRFQNLRTSLSNYVAGETNAGGYFFDSDNDLDNGMNLKNGYDGYAPWLSVLTFDGYAMSPTTSSGENFEGLYGDGTTGNGSFETVERGGIDEYNITFGGNILNTLYWGLGVGITDVNHYTDTYYSEDLSNAYLADGGVGSANWDLQNSLRTFGSGWNFKLGLIAVPIPELRLGFSFQTPTYFQLTDQYYADSYYNYPGYVNGDNYTPDGEVNYQVNTPWKFQASVATIINSLATLSFEYQYTGVQTSKLLDASGRDDFEINNTIKEYMRATNTYKIGMEVRVSPQFSIRAGYSYETSPVKNDVINNQVPIITSGTMPAYNIIRNTQYITAGVGYKYKHFYTDFAVVNRTRTNDYHAFSPAFWKDEAGKIQAEQSPTAIVKDNNLQLVLSVGFRF